MKAEPFDYRDLELLPTLQPEEWGDIRPFFQYYLRSAFCLPVKFGNGKGMIGVGVTIRHKTTAWLAHIIVRKDQRNKGIGSRITTSLIDLNRQEGYTSQMLIATELGYPVYLKNGFQTDTEYALFWKGKEFEQPVFSENIVPFKQTHWEAVLRLDRKISGEQRSEILKTQVSDVVVYCVGQRLEGYYFPSLWDGMIIADNPTAGLELMKYRLQEKDHVMLPVENKPGIRFLEELAFVQEKQVKRMYFGKRLDWKPEGLFNRIGGHLG